MYTARSFAVFIVQRETLKAPQKIHYQSSQIMYSSQTYQPTLVQHLVPFVLFVFDKLDHIDYSMHYEYQTIQLIRYTCIYIYMYFYNREY